MKFTVKYFFLTLSSDSSFLFISSPKVSERENYQLGVLRCKRIHKAGQTFSFNYLASQFNLLSHTEILTMTSTSYSEKGKQTLLNFIFSLNLLKTLPCSYVKHVMFLFFAFYNAHLHSFQLSHLFYVILNFIIGSLSSFFFQFLVIYSNF